MYLVSLGAVRRACSLVILQLMRAVSRQRLTPTHQSVAADSQLSEFSWQVGW